MKIRVGRLRALIREAASNKLKDRTQQVVSSVVDSAEKFVDSVVAGSPDKQSAEELRQAAEQVVTLAKFLLGHQERQAEPVARLAKTALDMANKSGFWQRPTFLGKQEYVDDMQTMLRRLQKSRIDTLS